MKLFDLVRPDEMIFSEGPDREITSIAYHSDNVRPGAVFFAIEGQFHEGAEYIKEAVKNGALAAVTSGSASGGPDKYPEEITIIKVQDTRKALALASTRMYNNPSGKLTVIAVTGTKGKTTVAFMIRQILQEAGIKTGIIGTVKNGFDGHMEDASATTPQPPEINRLMAEMIRGGCRAAVMEVSSQGLMHSRADGIDIDIGVFTNISPDHIGEGEHKDFSDYLYWKSTLFQKCRRAVVNIDDPHTKDILKNTELEKIIYFGEKGAGDLTASQVSLKVENGLPKTTYMLTDRLSAGDKRVRRITINMAGRFNVQNSLCAIGAARLLDVPWDSIEAALAKVKVPGRVETVPVKGRFTAIVDYAHNGIAFKNMLSSLKEYEPERMILVFGCGGNRDVNRRKEMGTVAAEYGDIIIITSDNPRREDPMKIIDEIVMSVRKADVSGKKKVMILPDRRAAIEKALDIAEKGDMVVVAGKGHETYQIINDDVLHFDDKEVILSWRKDER